MKTNNQTNRIKFKNLGGFILLAILNLSVFIVLVMNWNNLKIDVNILLPTDKISDLLFIIFYNFCIVLSLTAFGVLLSISIYITVKHLYEMKCLKYIKERLTDDFKVVTFNYSLLKKDTFIKEELCHYIFDVRTICYAKRCFNLIIVRHIDVHSGNTVLETEYGYEEGDYSKFLYTYKID